MTTSVVLPDSTVVYLNSESSLRYPSVFEGDIRNVELKGEAYFAVTKQVTKPFIVCLDQAEITVLGTEFNVRNYENEAIATTLVKGSVSVTDNSNISECRLRPGQQAVLENNEIRIRVVNVEEQVAWRHGAFGFTQCRLENIMEELARWYDVDVVYEDEEVKDYPFGCNFSRHATIEPLLKVFEATGTIETSIHGRKIWIRKRK